MMTQKNDFFFIVSIDVEEDMPDWKAEKHVTTRNISSTSVFIVAVLSVLPRNLRNEI